MAGNRWGAVSIATQRLCSHEIVFVFIMICLHLFHTHTHTLKCLYIHTNTRRDTYECVPIPSSCTVTVYDTPDALKVCAYLHLVFFSSISTHHPYFSLPYLLSFITLLHQFYLSFTTILLPSLLMALSHYSSLPSMFSSTFDTPSSHSFYFH